MLDELERLADLVEEKYCFGIRLSQDEMIEFVKYYSTTRNRLLTIEFNPFLHNCFTVNAVEKRRDSIGECAATNI